MKARVKATNKIVDIYEQTLLTTFDSNDVRLDEVEFLEGDTNFTPDYWTRLEHQAAIGAMQAYIIASHISQFSFCEGDMKDCKSMAHALVEKLKGKEE
jgi:hypothetical protein